MKRKLILCTVLSVLLVAWSAFGSSLSLHSVDGLTSADSLYTDSLVTFYIQVTNTEGTNIDGLLHGFRVYSEEGAEWTTTTADTLGTLTGADFNLVWSIKYYGVTGSEADSVGVGGSRLTSPGMPAGFDDTVWSITIGPIDPSFGARHICLDSSFAPPSGAWKWAKTGTAGIFPDWDGPHCWPVESPVSVMKASVSSVEFTVDGTQPEDQVFTILMWDGSTDKTVDVSGALDAKAGGDLTFVPSSGTHGTEITVSLDATGLAIGDYTGMITLSSAETFNPTFEIGVDVSVTTPLSVKNLTDENALPKTFTLGQNYPNPFNPTTQVAFDLPVRTHVTLTVYNVLGQQVRTLVDEPLSAGRYEADWDGHSSSGAEVASGVYFYRLHTEQFTQTKKMVLLK